MNFLILVFTISIGLSVWCFSQQFSMLSYEQLVSKMGINPLLVDDIDKPEISQEEVFRLISPYLYLKNFDYVTLYIRRAPISFENELALIRKIIRSDLYGFTKRTNAQLVLSVANTYSLQSSEQDAILDVLLQLDLIPDINPIIIAVDNDYETALAALPYWFDKKPRLKAIAPIYKHQALLHIIQTDNLAMFRVLNTVIGPIQEQMAIDLAWHIVKEAKGVSVLPELMALGVNLNAVREGKTLLLEAVMQQDLAMVELLIKLGADVNQVADLEIGSPLQQALEKGAVEIETVLRNEGAHE